MAFHVSCYLFLDFAEVITFALKIFDSYENSP